MIHRLFISIIFIVCSSSSTIAQDGDVIAIDTLLAYGPEDFSVITLDNQLGSLIRPASSNIDFNYSGLAGEPAMPYITVNVTHSKGTVFKDLKYSTHESLFAEPFVMVLNEEPEPMGDNTRRTFITTSDHIDATPNDIYPSQPVEVAAEFPPFPQFGQEHPVTVLRVYPFRYEANSHQLFLNREIFVHLIYSIDKTSDAIHDISAPYIEKRETANSQCFDLSGRQLSTPPIHGVYIRDGKKVLVK